MATLTFKGLKEYEMELSRFGKDIERIAGAAIYQGAGIVADEIKKGIEGLPTKTGVTKQGLIDGFGISGLQNDNGYRNVKLGFDGYNENGVPNVLMARIFESGTSRMPKHPFIRPAINASKKRAEDEMARILDEEIEKVMK